MPSATFRFGDSDQLLACEAGGRSVLLDRARGVGPSSIEFLLLALGSCTIGTLRNYMNRKGLSTSGTRVAVSCDFDEAANHYRNFRVELAFGDGIAADQAKILRSVAKTCRIHKTLSLTSEIAVDLVSDKPAAGAP